MQILDRPATRWPPLSRLTAGTAPDAAGRRAVSADAAGPVPALRHATHELEDAKRRARFDSLLLKLLASPWEPAHRKL